MNAIYRRYRTDERFRAALLASAHRERAQAIARFMADTAAYLFPHRSRHAARSRLARQG